MVGEAENTVKCTEPELWATIPDWDAPDELIQKYIDHLSACRYHAEIERSTEESARLTFEAARSVTENSELSFSEQEEAEVLNALERFSAFRESGMDVGQLSLKVAGREIGKLDFAKRRKEKLKISREQPLQIFGRAGAAGPELLLATYVPVVQDHSGSYLVALNDHQSLRFEVKPSRGAKVKLTISCTTPAGEKFGLLRSRVWSRPELIAAGVGVLTIAIAVIIFYSAETKKIPNENIVYTARNEVNDNQQRPIPPESPRPSVEPSRNVAPPAPKGLDNNRPSVTPKESKSRSGSVPTPQINSLRDVHKLFVDEQESGFRQVVRSAVVKRLGELGFITEVSREDSDARLRLRWKGVKSVRFQILSGDRELLNYDAVFDDTTPEAADTLALKLKGRVKEKLK
jgi:hypothetical protein